jgi:hypothetical protein
MPLFEATIQLIQICGECQQLNNHCDTGNVNIGMQGLVTIQDYDTMSGHFGWAHQHAGRSATKGYNALPNTFD